MNNNKNNIFFWFDFGGVLTPPIETLFELYHQKTGIPSEQLQNAMKAVAVDMNLPTLAPIEKAIITEAEWGKRLRDALSSLYPFTDKTKAQLEKFGKQWFEEVKPNTSIIKPIKNMLNQVFRAEMLTNNVIEWEPYWQPLIGLNGLVEHIVDSCKVKYRKPEHAFFEIAEQHANVTSEQYILIDDLLENCISAKNRGWQSIHFVNNDDCIEKLNKIIGKYI